MINRRRCRLYDFVSVFSVLFLVIILAGFWVRTFRETTSDISPLHSTQGIGSFNENGVKVTLPCTLKPACMKANKANKIRKRSLAAACRIFALKKKFRLMKETHVYRSFIHLPDYHMLYCHIPKVASTLNMQILSVLSDQFETKIPHEILYYKAYVLLQTALKYSNLTSDMLGSNTFKYMFTRDPYQRLYSVYLDKFWSHSTTWYNCYPNTIRLVRLNASSQAGTCQRELSFAEFISFVLYTITAGEADTHWQPYSDGCQPCHVKYDFIGKVETFKRDLTYVLETTRTSSYVNLSLVDAVSDDYYINTTITNIKKHQTMINDSSCSAKCLHDVHFIERQWATLQLRGIISRNSTFPRRKLHEPSPALYRQLVYEARRSSPVSKKERELVKSNALHSAYETIPPVNILRIQQAFYPDFRLFGYNFYPPTSKDKSKNSSSEAT